MNFSRFSKSLVIPGIALAATLCLDASSGNAREIPFSDWLVQVRQEAATKGISGKTLDQALGNLEPNPRIIELDRRQPEFSLTFWKYLNGSVNEKRIARAAALLKKHKKLFDRIADQYGVQGRFLVAFWGLETNFGDHFGSFPVIQSLATLAYDERRSEFFQRELMDALSIVDRGDMPSNVMGSWAGAMGNCQFMPSTYKMYALDGDGDGKRDLWGSLPDVFASAANFLSKSGWKGDETWGREVKLPKGFDLDLEGLKIKKTLSEWQGLGIRKINGSALPKVDLMASLVLPAGVDGPAFLVYQNFRSTLAWNQSIYYAIAVGHLADRMVGMAAFKTPQTDEVALSRQQVIEMQELLNSKGFEVGKPDGIAGSMTRKAIKSYQRSIGKPADGYPSVKFLETLRK